MSILSDQVTEAYAKGAAMYSKRMPRDKKPSLVFKFNKPIEKPDPFVFAPGISFLDDHKKLVTLSHKDPVWKDDRWEDEEGAGWTEGYLREQFKSGKFKYLNHQKP